jgi:hypothetical protein
MTDEELTDEELVKALRDTYDLVKMWPEKRPDGFTNLLVLRNLVPDTADRIEALTAERDEHWKSFVHWRKEADALSEQLEAARADAKEAEAYAEELERDLNICRMAQVVMENGIAEAEKERDHWQDVAGREGVCMTCRGPRGAPEPYGCSDCFNTGYCGEWHNEMHELREERERLALAICGGEDAPGYANAQTVDTLEKVARDNANATMEQINRTLAVEAKLAKAVELLKEARQDLEEYVTHEWPKDEHPVYERKWERDMELCRRIDATLAEIEGEKT